MSTTLAPWNVRDKVTRWRAPAPVHELLEDAHAHGVERVYITGERQRPGWLFEPTPGWAPGAHFVDGHGLDVGRFTHERTGRQVMIARAASWFGEGDYTPLAAAAAHELLEVTYGALFRWGGADARLLDSPAATGLDAWLRSIPDVHNAPPMLDDELRALIRRTSPQHRVEMFTPTDDELPGFHYLDGRMMYGALTRELGCGPVQHLTGDRAQLFAAAWPYVRARYLVRFEVPRDWDTLGLLMAPYEGRGCDDTCCPGTVRNDGEDSREWHAPHRPGWRGVTWCDAAELHVATMHGWHVTVLEALVFATEQRGDRLVTVGRPLDVWSDRLVKLRDRLADAPDATDEVRDLARGAVRAILLYAIGAFHSTGRRVTRVAASPRQAPDHAMQQGEVWVWHEHAPLSGRNALLSHPEWSSQVWGRAHARILESPTGRRDLPPVGALAVPFGNLLGIRGDALYATQRLEWPDDGRIGRLRPKGWLDGPLKAPQTWTQLNRLRARAERQQ